MATSEPTAESKAVKSNDNGPDAERGDRLHIVMLSLHGLIRGHDLELGHDADTGGQTKYVVELARALGELAEVERVDLITRRIDDTALSDDYAKPFERLSERANLIRIRAGGDDYARKELLWPYLDEFVQSIQRYYRAEGLSPDIVHGHYADAGYVAARLAAAWKVPFVFTGHSLGRNKRRVLRADGMSGDEIEEQYNISQRIEVEEEVLRRADLVVASTRQEVEKGYELYDAAANSKFVVIPPGIDVDRFYPYYYDLDEAFEPDEDIIKARVRMRREIARFLREPEKPLVLAISRPDRRKNIEGLVRAYGEDNELRHIANLAVFAGVRGDIEAMDQNEREVLTGMLLAMDRYDLYGRLALPKKHQPDTDIPVLYRLVAARRGVFVNTALVENFGITLIEASSSGLPVVSTDHGGPAEIIKTCQSGELIDARDTGQIQAALKGILVDREKWERYSENGIAGVREHYSWSAHANKYLESVRRLEAAEPLRAS
ncbi:MAG TPA: glycosyltransferase [Trueperaceae bacterium]|nr:glycosyltransferase [Trueperaceae bacterium]